jgi:hypothetical protein
MKRADLIRHLEQHGCLFVREGGKPRCLHQSLSSPVFYRASASGNLQIIANFTREKVIYFPR